MMYLLEINGSPVKGYRSITWLYKRLDKITASGKAKNGRIKVYNLRTGALSHVVEICFSFGVMGNRIWEI